MLLLRAELELTNPRVSSLFLQAASLETCDYASVANPVALLQKSSRVQPNTRYQDITVYGRPKVFGVFYHYLVIEVIVIHAAPYLSEVAQEVLSTANEWSGYTRLHDLTTVFKLNVFNSVLFSLEHFFLWWLCKAQVWFRCQNPVWGLKLRGSLEDWTKFEAAIGKVKWKIDKTNTNRFLESAAIHSNCQKN